MTAALGLALGGLAWKWQLPRIAYVVPGIVTLLGAVLITLRRDLVFDRDDGVLRIEQQLLGIASRTVVPLFHLRAVVIAAWVSAPSAVTTCGPRPTAARNAGRKES